MIHTRCSDVCEQTCVAVRVKTLVDVLSIGQSGLTEVILAALLCPAHR